MTRPGISSQQLSAALVVTSLCFVVIVQAFGLGIGGATASNTGSIDSAAAKGRNLSFPPKSIGLLLVASKDRAIDTAKQIGGAQGQLQLQVPPNHWLILEINQNGFLHPELLDSCSVDGIDVLKVSFLSMADGEEVFCNRALAHVSKFTHIKYLDLDSSDCSDEGLEQVAANLMPQLMTISAEASQLRGTFLKKLKFSQISTLSLASCQVSADSLASLSKYKKLMSLRLAHTNLGLPGVRTLTQCTQLQNLDLSDNQKVDDECLKCLAPLVNLESLGLSGTRVTAHGLAQLKYPKLKKLFLAKSQFSDKEWTELEKKFPVTTFAYLDQKKRSRSSDLNMILAPTGKYRR